MKPHFKTVSLARICGILALMLLASGGSSLYAQDAQAAEEEPSRTVVESRYTELRSTIKRNYFMFKDDVTVTANNMTVSCDYLEVITMRSGDPDATIGQIGDILSVIAKGNVVILQAGRQALCGKAEVYPLEGRVVMTENPVVVEEGARVSGCIITLIKGERKARIEPCEGAEGPSRSTVILDGLPDIGPDPEE